jgi:SSS family solute:Na+ symporter
VPLKLIDVGLKIYATGIFISAGLGYDLRLSVIGSGVVMSLYTFMGGLWAVVVTDYVQFVILTIGVAVLFPLVFSHMGGIGAGLETIWRDHPAGFLSPFAHPYSIVYIIAFYLLVILSYNGNWAFAQKFYSVRNEREARKAGILATILKILGPPLFVLPAMAAHYLMPELAQPPNSPQYTYAAMSLKYLPAGLVGLMIAAMFSATMSTLSGDFNVIASVLTEDIYHRLIRKDASPRHLMITGRVTTLLAGTITILIGIVLVETARTGLFEVMVALFSLFVGPMLLPMLAGLLSRRLTWRGATAGIVAGFISGFSLYLYKTLVLAKQLPNGSESSRYNFEAISILVNIAITLVAMTVTTLLERKTAAEHARIDSFFRRLDQPVSLPESLATGKPFSPMPVIGWTTFGVGCLLMCSAVMLPAGSGRTIDVAVGLFLCISGGGFYLLGRGRG